MYQVVTYYLLFLIAYAIIWSLTNQATDFAYQVAFFLATSSALGLAFNWLVKRYSKFHPTTQSSLITVLILTLIIGPLPVGTNSLLVVAVAVIGALASKLLLTWRGRHVFNPAAVGTVASGLLVAEPASWWVSLPSLWWVTLIGGLLILVKLKRWNITLIFLLAYLALRLGTSQLPDYSYHFVSRYLDAIFTYSPLVFFGSVMLIEPMTVPGTKRWQLVYALLVAVALRYYPQYTHSLPVDAAILALLTGNLFAALTRRDSKQFLKLKSTRQIAKDAWEFNFLKNPKFSFQAGQYLHWHLPHRHPDSRGEKRDFTIASAPEEPVIRLITRLVSKSSSFKSELKKLKVGDSLNASQVDGSFTLPAATEDRLLWLAGGIGVTPFLSMTNHLLATGQKRDIVLLYAAQAPEDLIYREQFQKAESLGLKTHYVVEKKSESKGWKGETGQIDEELIKKLVPDYRDRTVYISGPKPMVEAFEKKLIDMHVARGRLKTDDFPGYEESYSK